MVDTYYGYKYVLCDVIYEWDVTPDYPDGHWVKVSATPAEENTEPKPPVFPTDPEEGDTVEAVEMTWIVDNDASDTLYQVPVMKVSGMPYKRYTAVITVYYRPGLDHHIDENNEKTEFDFYLDAIRIYDPANDGKDNETVEDAYVADGEGWPEYFELRNLLISKNDFDNLEAGTGKGIVFIDNTQDSNNRVTYSIEDYRNYGPNNELYLAPGQAVAFELAAPGNVAGIHLAMKTVGGRGASANVEYYSAQKSGNTVTKKDLKTLNIATATDLYYDITGLNNKTVVISNTDSSNAILSITNVKITYQTEHSDSVEAGYFRISKDSGNSAVKSLMFRTAGEPVQLAITKQPADVQAVLGEKLTIDVEAEGEGLTYQWYYKNKTGRKFTASKRTGNTYSMTMASRCDGRRVYCVVTDQYGNSVTSETVTITRARRKLKILSQPQDVQVELGERVNITVEAQGEGLTYKWYYKNSNGKKYAVSGITGNTYSMTMADRCHGRRVYCVITDRYGKSVKTEVATMTCPSLTLKILSQPQNVQAEIGERITITVEAQGKGLTYKWYYKNKSGKKFAASSLTGNSYSMTMAERCDGRQVYCVITDQYGSRVTSETVTISVAENNP
jgi:hypothetical protein